MQPCRLHVGFQELFEFRERESARTRFIRRKPCPADGVSRSIEKDRVCRALRGHFTPELPKPPDEELHPIWKLHELVRLLAQGRRQLASCVPVLDDLSGAWLDACGRHEEE